MLLHGAVCKAGQSKLNKTGSWRDLRPEVLKNCNGCGICETYCPDSCIKIQDGKSIINYDYCKGCGICAVECVREAIVMREERK